jgi:plasmid maintenance system antidote protein VapI/DNA-binding NarL/FixJ family response regulator
MRGALNLVLFCSDGATKQRFKESFQAGKHDVVIHLAEQPGDIDARLKKNLAIDFILVATRTYDSRIELVRMLAPSEQNKSPPPVFVLVKEAERDGTMLSALLSAGADGVIAEPLRVEAIEEAVEHMLASAKYKSFRDNRSKAILTVTMSNAALMVDQLARAQRGETSLSTSELRERPRMLDNMTALWGASSPDVFANALLTVCSARAPAPAREEVRRGRRPKRVIHPAKIVTRIMNSRGISAEKLATVMRMDIATVNEFLSEASEMTEELAENFGRVLGHDKEYWLSLNSTATPAP